VVARYRRAGKAESPEFITPLGNLAGVYTRVKRFEEAIRAAREGSELSMKVYGPDHGSTVISQQTLGLCLSKAGRVEEALAVLEPAYRKATGEKSPIEAKWRRQLIASTYAYALAENKRFEEAVATQGAALDACVGEFGERHFASLRLMEQSTKILEMAGKTEESAAMRARWERAKAAK
jgi:tetratricopeptide (TPR) repeat protein